MIKLTWDEYKSFYDQNKTHTEMSYIEHSDRYDIWSDFRDVKVMVSNLQKSSTEGQEFESTYKAQANQPRFDRVRITTCQAGRRSNYRYISFTTARDQQFDNTDFKERDFGDVTYSMLDAAGLPTTDNSLARETHISFQPTYDYEVSGGMIDIPADLGSTDLDLWELHVVAAPKIPAAYGGEFPFFANSRLKFNRGMRIGMDESLNPAEISGAASPYAREILIVIKHPLGAQREFQVMIKIFRSPT